MRLVRLSLFLGMDAKRVERAEDAKEARAENELVGSSEVGVCRVESICCTGDDELPG